MTRRNIDTLQNELNRRVTVALDYELVHGEPFPGFNAALGHLREAWRILSETQCDVDSEYVTQAGNQAAGATHEAIDLLLDEAAPRTDEGELPW